MQNLRQDAILVILERNGQMSAPQILAELLLSYPKLSKPTVLRDLATLINGGKILKTGKARSVKYRLYSFSPLLATINTDKYFLDAPDKRHIKSNFNWNIFSDLRNIFDNAELARLENLNFAWQKRRAAFPATAIKKELERLTIELSWKSSQLEGNNYSLLDTEQLITKATRAPGHSNEEADMILGHKNALEYILSNPTKFQTLTADSVRIVHSLIIQNLGIPDDWRKILVGITGSAYKPLGNQWQIQEAVEKSCTTINAEPSPVVKAFLSGALIAYIQPFVDGNKRTGRLITDAILWAHDWCPLSYRSIDEVEYKKAILLIYEQNNFRLFKKLFIEQFEFAVKNYFGE
jgi:Fic family protein